MNKKFVVGIASLLSVACLLGGCGGNDVVSNGSPVTLAEGDSVYPLQCEDTLTVWSTSLPGDLNTSPIGKEWSKKTGVNVLHEQPMGNMQALNTLLAAGDLPDVIVTALSSAPGGVQKQYEDGVIIQLDDYLEKWAPNLTKYLKENPDVDKTIKSDDGHYYCFPSIQNDSRLKGTVGVALREDLLKKTGLEVPETIDEWTEVLRAFKELGCDAPLSYDMIQEWSTGFFFGAWDVIPNFMVNEGKVVYGFEQPAMIDALKQFNAWYEEGLLDRNIVSVPDLDGQILTGKTAATVTWAGSGIGKYMNAMKEVDPEFSIIPVKNPVLVKGTKSKFGAKKELCTNQSNAYITTECKNIELAVRFLDYAYGEEGIMMTNFGIEGVSYNMIDGYPTYTELITNNPDGKSISEAFKDYMLYSSAFPGIQDFRYLEQYYQIPQQKMAPPIWSDTENVMSRLPQLLTYTTEESDKLSEIDTNIRTYADEMMFKFITGVEPFENYDKFLETLKTYRVDEAIAIHQAALDRYMNR